MVRLIVPVVIGLLFLAVIAGWFWYTTWLVRSAIDELAHRRRLLAGVDPLQVTATKAAASVEAAHDAAHRALSLTVESWYDLRESRAVGTSLVERFPKIEERAARDPEFLDVLEDADALLNDARPGADEIDELLGRTARMDELTLRLRTLVHQYDSAGRRGFGRFFPQGRQ
ncbi:MULTISPECIES: hypothetical protein [unclassified Dietzia]|uniref:hypothetical protein n=1 Tax=unclassified Dietzia TaxID=2617939 RepID=UPI000D202581|nr:MULTISPECIES: hypothetical protein [unclassified Dietzia]AVZ40319.1 hypothetical protein CT688_13410 [Dietzia sp. JS16-p6b]QGW25796.1 hypothetical protein GJR88_04251 [Dietzia sp. DQ12-45-1b]